MSKTLAVIKLRRDDTFEPECVFTTRRLQGAKGLLKSMGIEPVITHDPQCTKTLIRYGMAYKCEGHNEYGHLPCLKVEWPEWVTDEILDEAYNLVSNVTTARGRHNREEARVLRASKAS